MKPLKKPIFVLFPALQAKKEEAELALPLMLAC